MCARADASLPGLIKRVRGRDPGEVAFCEAARGTQRTGEIEIRNAVPNYSRVVVRYNGVGSERDAVRYGCYRCCQPPNKNRLVTGIQNIASSPRTCGIANANATEISDSICPGRITNRYRVLCICISSQSTVSHGYDVMCCWSRRKSIA